MLIVLSIYATLLINNKNKMHEDDTKNDKKTEHIYYKV